MYESDGTTANDEPMANGTVANITPLGPAHRYWPETLEIDAGGECSVNWEEHHQIMWKCAEFWRSDLARIAELEKSLADEREEHNWLLALAERTVKLAPGQHNLPDRLAAIIGENAVLRDKVGELEKSLVPTYSDRLAFREQRDRIAELEAQLAASKASVVKLREALRPFAKAADVYSDAYSNCRLDSPTCSQDVYFNESEKANTGEEAALDYLSGINTDTYFYARAALAATADKEGGEE